jgi:hypothetical protein
MKERGACFKRYYRWATTSGYSDHVGLGSSVWYPGVTINKSDLISLLSTKNSLSSNQDIQINTLTVDFYDEFYFADFWVYQNRPADIGTAYTVDKTYTRIGSHKEYGWYYDDWENGWTEGYHSVNDYRTDITIKFTDGSSVTLDTSSYDHNNRYLYCIYTITTTTYETQTVNGVVTQVPVVTSVSKQILYGYQTGDTDFDKFFTVGEPQYKTYFPYIPLRHQKNWYSSDYEPETWNWIKKAYRKITGSESGNTQYNTLIDNLEDNDSISDVNFTYINLGIPINTEYDEGKEYIFTFFYDAILNESLDSGSDTTLIEVDDSTSAANDLWAANPEHCIYINSKYGMASYDIKIYYRLGYFGKRNGQAAVGLKPGQYYFKPVYQESYEYDSDDSWIGTTRITYLHLYKQESENTYFDILFTQLQYNNFVYNGKAVKYYAAGPGTIDYRQSCSDYYLMEIMEPDASGFVIPLQYQTFNKMSLTNATDLAKRSMIMVFNSYQIKRTKWYQSGLFQIVTFVIAVILAYFTGGQSITIWAALYTGICVLILGLVIQYFIMPWLMEILTPVLGEKAASVVSAIICAIVAIVCMNFSAFMNSGLSAMSSILSTAQGAMSVVNAGIQAVSSALNTSAQQTYNKMSTMLTDTQDQIKSIDNKMKELLGSNSLIDMDYVNGTLYQAYFEMPSTFLQRTVLTGSDICEMTFSYIKDFSDISLNVDVINS